MNQHKRTRLASIPALLGAGSLLIGCATATNDEAGKPGVGGDAAIAGRADAAPGIRPDANPLQPDATPVSNQPDAGPLPDAATGCTVGPANLLNNGDFDLGQVMWTEASGGSPDPYDLIVADSEITGVTADSGSFLTWLGGYSGSGAIDTFHQDLAVPGDATAMSVTGKIWIDSAESPLLAWDTLTLEIVNPSSGAVLEEVGSWSNIDLGTGWTNLSENVSGNYAGQAIRVRFTAEMDFSNNTSFLLDTLALNTTTCQ